MIQTRKRNVEKAREKKVARQTCGGIVRKGDKRLGPRTPKNAM
jgi:hypothetical protein